MRGWRSPPTGRALDGHPGAPYPDDQDRPDEGSTPVHDVALGSIGHLALATPGASGDFNPYVPILVMLAISVGFVAFSLVANALAGPKRYNRAKLDAYECGIDPTPQAAGGGRFPVKYYLVAMTFIIFDIEVVFLYPWAVAFSELALFGLVAMLGFIFLITVPFVYEWRRGGFEWD